MADIKTRDFAKGTIKTIDRAAIAGDRMKRAYISTKERAEHSTYAADNSVDEYASDKVERGVDTAVHEGVHQFDKVGRKGLRDTKENVQKAKDGIDRFKGKQAEQSLKKQVQNVRNKTIKTVEKPTEKTVKQSVTSAGKKTIKTAGKGSGKVAAKSVKTAERTAKTAIKTTQQAAKTAQKTAQVSVKAAQKAAQVAKATAKAVAAAVKVAVKATLTREAQTSHSGGTATCTALAACQYCGTGYGSLDANNHNVTKWESCGSNQHKGICEWCSNGITTEGCSFTNGICSICGGYQQAEKNNKDYYEISNLGQLCWLAQKVNAQEITSHNAILTADITIDNSVVWVPISLADHSGSTFDGNNHTITFANTRDGSTFGLFSNYNYSTIKNLYLAGSITCNQSGDTSALVNRAYSTTIQNVISTCTVNNSGTGNTGGLTGYFGGGTATIKNCAVYADVTGGGYAGGLIGSIWNGNQAIQNVSNCAYMGSVTGGNKAGALVGYNGNNSSKKSPFTDVYYCEKNGLGYLGATYGGTITATRLESVTADQFKSGEVAYKLNNGVTDGTQVWYQTCQSEAYPKFSGKTVYMGYICDSGNSDPVYRNSMDGLISVPSPEHKWDNGVCTNCGTTQAAVWDETEQVYKISNLVQLQWFADKVNGGETSINGKLMANIDASTLTSLAIGVNGKAYSGTFDGNGYTLTIGLNSTAEYAAPFRYVNGATIKNLTVKGFITTNQKFAASIVGLSDGKTTIENCISTVEITSTKSGDGTHGGLVANVSSGTMTINNCGFVGQINGSGTDSCGGLVGWSNGTTNISNSFVAATFTVAIITAIPSQEETTLQLQIAII